MSCSLCRLPFTPGPTSVYPHPPLPGILNEKLYNYFRWGVAMGSWVPGAVTNLEWLDNNSFGNMPSIPMVLNVRWESPGGTVRILVCHTVCATIVRATFDAQDDSLQAYTDLCQIEKVLGRPMMGAQGGRLSGVDYEGVGHKVDLRPFWALYNKERIEFNWHAFMSNNLGWMLNRPDVFPRFRPTVTAERLNFRPSPTATSDILTIELVDILRVLLSYLSDASFVLLLSTCRSLRRHALTTFQPHARVRVLTLGWAVPLAHEYAREAELRAKNGQAPVPMAHAQKSPYDGDWMLYLSHVHRSASMRARRHLWAIALELRRAYDEKLG
ncbi:hypothetical protein BKA93DRAFT_731076 [Sparassis latifolia]